MSKEPVILDAATAKRQWRIRLNEGRRARTAVEIATARGQVAERLKAFISESGPAAIPAGSTVCVYLPLASEPLAASFTTWLRRNGFRVLAPITPQRGLPLDWAELGDTAYSRGPLGVLEPAGKRSGPGVIATAAAILVPALAVDAQGRRLGRGAGYYDRSLGLIGVTDATSTPRPRIIAIVFADEFVAELPVERHDVPVTDVVTPTGGYRLPL